MADKYDGLTLNDIVSEKQFEESGQINSKAFQSIYSLQATGNINADGTPEYRVVKNNALADFYMAISQEQDEDIINVYKFGRASSVGATEIAVWDGATTATQYTFPAAGGTVTIISDNVNDAPAGIGARSVHFFGLDTNWELQDEIIEVGATSVNTYLRGFRMHVEETGTPNSTGAGNNLGTITATHNDASTVIARILPNVGQTLMAIYTIPAGFTAYMINANSTSSEGKAVITQLKSRDNNVTNAPFRTRGIRDSFQNQVGTAFKVPNKYTEKTDLVFTATSSAAGTSVSSAFQLLLVKNR